MDIRNGKGLLSEQILKEAKGAPIRIFRPWSIRLLMGLVALTIFMMTALLLWKIDYSSHNRLQMILGLLALGLFNIIAFKLLSTATQNRPVLIIEKQGLSYFISGRKVSYYWDLVKEVSVQWRAAKKKNHPPKASLSIRFDSTSLSKTHTSLWDKLGGNHNKRFLRISEAELGGLNAATVKKIIETVKFSL